MRLPTISPQASHFPLLTATLSLLTSTLSILLTYTLQSPWRSITRPPFISDAHYDQIQSPIFAATATLTAASTIPTILLTHQQTPSTSSTAPSKFPLSAPQNIRPWIRILAPLFGICSAIFLFLAAAIHARFEAHFILISLSFACSLFWACCVSLTLSYPTEPVEHVDLFVRAGMQVCVVATAGAVLALVGAHAAKVYRVSAGFEYGVVIGLDAFLVMLAWMIRGKRVMWALDGEREGRTPLLRRSVAQDGQEGVEMSVLAV